MLSCEKKQSILELIEVKDLNFPSASAIEVYYNKLYLFVYDATQLLVV